MREILEHLGAPTHSNFDPTDRDNQRRMNSDFLSYNIANHWLVRTVLHGLMSTAFRPEVSSGFNASEVDPVSGHENMTEDADVGVAAAEWLAEGNSLMVVGNHQWIGDHEIDVAAFYRVPGLSAIPERGRILSKVEYFDIYDKQDASGNKLKPSLLQKAVDVSYRILNAVPVTRPEKDLSRMIPPLSEEDASDPNKIRQRQSTIREATLVSNQETEKVSVEILKNGERSEGGIVAIYLEGERIRGDWAKIGEPTDLAARILKRAEAEGIKVAVLVYGRSYGVEKESHPLDMNFLSPQIHLGSFLKGSFARKTSTTKRMSSAMQSSLSAAHERSLGHPPLPIANQDSV